MCGGDLVCGGDLACVEVTWWVECDLVGGCGGDLGGWR